MKNGAYFGIDFGTTNTSVYLYHYEKGVGSRETGFGTNGKDLQPFSSCIAISKSGMQDVKYGREVKENINSFANNYKIITSFKSLLGTDEEIVVNGMSAAERNSAWSNAAIVVETRPEDIEEIARELSADQKAGGADFGLANDSLAGLRFRRWLERETWLHGGASLGLESNPNAAPAQRLVDFLAGRPSESLPRSSYTPGLVPSRLDLWLPPFVARRLKEGFKAFDKNMRGFISPDALLIASETRTSTPVRIKRDKATFECAGLSRLYPCGEGSGWSGGIVSSALDGINVAVAVAASLSALD